jgi:predicted HD superfamily hydrolase involved in NAD metabolism
MRESSLALDASAHDALHLKVVQPPENSSASSQSSDVEPLVDRSAVLHWLGNQVPPKRLQHILRVEDLSAQLALTHGLNPQHAALAGLMHDLAKCFQPKRLLKVAQTHGIEIDPVDEATPHLLHAEVGAVVARDQFGIYDQRLLDAIRNHTLGRPNMSLLSCVVFLADSLEPGRGDTSELQGLRQVAQTNLHQAVWQTCDWTVKFLLENRQLIHPRAIQTRNWAMQMARSSKPFP